MKLIIKRLLAYIIDMLIVFVLTIGINSFINDNIYDQQLKNANEEYTLKNITFEEYKNKYIELTYKIDINNFGINLVTTLFIIIIFIVIPYFKKQTIGQSFLKIKLNKVNIPNLLTRCTVINGLGYMIIMLIILFLFSDNIYFILINFLAFCQISLVFINGFMILYKKDHLGLIDILTNSRIEEIK